MHNCIQAEAAAQHPAILWHMKWTSNFCFCFTGGKIIDQEQKATIFIIYFLF